MDVKTTCVQSIDMTLREDVWVHKTSLTWPCFIEVSVLGQESEQSCTCGFGYRFYLLSTISRLDFETSDNTVFYVFFSFLLINIMHWSGVSKWASIRYFYPSEIVYSTGRNYWTPPKISGGENHKYDGR